MLLRSVIGLTFPLLTFNLIVRLSLWLFRLGMLNSFIHKTNVATVIQSQKNIKQLKPESLVWSNQNRINRSAVGGDFKSERVSAQLPPKINCVIELKYYIINYMCLNFIEYHHHLAWSNTAAFPSSFLLRSVSPTHRDINLWSLEEEFEFHCAIGLQEFKLSTNKYSLDLSVKFNYRLIFFVDKT